VGLYNSIGNEIESRLGYYAASVAVKEDSFRPKAKKVRPSLFFGSRATRFFVLHKYSLTVLKFQ
jgi:hypothetical protein